jgi:hypothetical protein
MRDTQLGVYRITGNRAYRGHEPGAVVEMALQPGPEYRAVTRGDIQLLERIEAKVPEQHSLPPGWLKSSTAVNRGAERRLSHTRR